MSQTIAIYPGTFDPITKGHETVLSKACKIFDLVIIAVAKDTEKKTKLSLDKRIQLVSSINAPKNVLVKSFSGLLVNFAKDNNCKVIIRGLRSGDDFNYEQQIAQTNYILDKNIQTVFLTTNLEAAFISSSLVHQVAKLGGSLDKLVSGNVAHCLTEFYSGS
jgi:pantetheine-phosphate adenylyltransferase